MNIIESIKNFPIELWAFIIVFAVSVILFVDIIRKEMYYESIKVILLILTGIVVLYCFSCVIVFAAVQSTGSAATEEKEEYDIDKIILDKDTGQYDIFVKSSPYFGNETTDDGEGDVILYTYGETDIDVMLTAKEPYMEYTIRKLDLPNEYLKYFYWPFKGLFNLGINRRIYLPQDIFTIVTKEMQ